MSQTIIPKYVKYKLFAPHKHGEGIDSPFVFELLSQVIERELVYYAYYDIDDLRHEILELKAQIEVTDLGAGSKTMSKKRSVAQIVKNSTIKRKFGEILFRLVHHFQPQTILELGTSLGISTLYLAMPNSKAQVFTIEGCPQTAAFAKENFKVMEVKNIHLHVGNFDDVLPKILAKQDHLDFVFIDGNHRKLPTLSYFEQLLPKIHENSVLVIDDIHWSNEMDEAWKQICQDQRVSITIDLFFMGLVFFRKDEKKQNFVINH